MLLLPWDFAVAVNFACAYKDYFRVVGEGVVKEVSRPLGVGECHSGRKSVKSFGKTRKRADSPHHRWKREWRADVSL